jgi:hypothetical protein
VKSLIIIILVFISGPTLAGQEFESILHKIQGKWHEQGQVCGTDLQFDYPDIVYIKTGLSEAHGKFKLNDGSIISSGFDYTLDINISENNGTTSCNGSILYEVGAFPTMSFKLEENDTLNIEGSIFKREK